MDGGAWGAAVHGVAESRTWLSDFTFTFHFHELEKEMATHSSVLAWRIPGTREPAGLLSMGSSRVWHDWSNLAAHKIKFLQKENLLYIQFMLRKIYFQFWIVLIDNQILFLYWQNRHHSKLMYIWFQIPIFVRYYINIQ